MTTHRLFVFLLIIHCYCFGNEIEPDFTIMIPMRDKVELPTDLYLPSKEAKNLPCILLRSPAGRRHPYWIEYAVLSKFGYVVAIQDTRSILDQEGKTLPYISDGWGILQDGYDTIEWLAKSSWTNGKIGTAGPSALGITQLLLAPSAPPSLVCQYINMASSDLYHQALFPGGQLLKSQAEGWLGMYAKDSGVYSYVINQPFYNDFWSQFNTVSMASKVKVPAIHYGGWFDTFLQGTIKAFKSRQEEGAEGAKGRQKLVIGPWTHYWPHSTTLGDFEVPLPGRVYPIDISLQRWFDYHLKGVENGIREIPSIIYYVMGPFDGSSSGGNVWRTASQWPIPSMVSSLYLSPQLGLNNKPIEESGTISYLYDPSNPIPTVGGSNLFLESGPKDQKIIESREDIIVFTSSPLEEEIELTGSILAKVFFATNKNDTDLVARLCDVYPDGRSILITDGVSRLGINHFYDMENNDGKPLEVNIDLGATSLVFAKGHRIRLSLSSSNYPRFEKNTNTGIVGGNQTYEIAENKLFVGGKYPSQIYLPIVRQGENWLVNQTLPTKLTKIPIFCGNSG